jgi:molybdate transport system ATP-binding protein
MLDARIKKHFSSGNGHSLTLDVEIKVSGGITVLFGSSGAGKTTLLRAIAGILTPDEGKISLGGNVYFDSGAGINLPLQ